MTQTLKGLDQGFFLFLNSFHAEWLDPVMVFLSGSAIWVPMILLVLFLGFKRNTGAGGWIFFLFLVLAFGASDVSASYIMKNLTLRLRPCHDPDILGLMHQFGQRCGGKYGFVSSHAANSFALVSFALVGLQLRSWFHFLWIAPVVVSFSRIYLGVHYPGDIMGGALIGTFWGTLFALGFLTRHGANR